MRESLKRPKRKPDLELPACEETDLGELHIWVDENVFVNVSTDPDRYFGPTIMANNGRYRAKDYIEYELEDRTTPARREMILNYMLEKEMLND